MAKKKISTQYAALPYVIQDGELRLLLITSRDTGRWIIPKGWPMKGLEGALVAATEAYEEAGVRGAVASLPFAEFDYLKRLSETKRKRCHVQVFPLRVTEELDDWPEKTQRRREWVSPAVAASRVAEARLIELLERLPAHPGALDPFGL